MKLFSWCLLWGILPIMLGSCVMPPSEKRPEAVDSWQRYLSRKAAGTATELPDFSYAGYKRGEAAIVTKGKVFDVRAYGATPDDRTDDLLAIKRAVSAARGNGGGIVQFPPGRFLINTNMAERGAIFIGSDNIVLRGSGCGAGGTIVHSIHPYGGGMPHNIKRLHLGRTVLLISSKPETKPIKSRRALCKVTADARRETFTVGVDDASSLSVGGRVLLYSGNSNILRDMTAPYEVEPEWTSIAQNKAYVAEIHTIAAIADDRVTFAEPIRYDVKAAQGWEIRPHKPISGIGVEDICFLGNSYHAYKHHRSGYDDGGWAFIKMRGVTDSWVRRCAFINTNQALAVLLSSYVSVLNIRVDGNQGHHIPRVAYYSYGVLNGLIADNAGFTHGPSVQGHSLGTVFWRTRGLSSIDCHSGAPYVTLFDRVAAGGFNSSGGLRDYPQHLRHMVLWNFENLEPGAKTYDFWTRGKNNRFVKPVIVGTTGQPVSFTDGSLERLESAGAEVAPASLYEAQLTHRLGKRPAWLDHALSDAEVMANLTLPGYYRRDGTGEPYLYLETFTVADMLDYVTSLSLQMFNSRQFTYAVQNPKLSLHTDQGYVRNILYSLMCYIYGSSRNNNTISVSNDRTDHTNMVTFTIRSGKVGGKIDPAASAIADAKAYAQLIGGTVTAETDPRLTFTVRIPGKE